MAVPFRGKDVAADRTEFGHPDVALSQTILAYYHSGLSDDQLSLCFEKLDHLEAAEQNKLITSWRNAISDVNIKEKIPTSYKNINLSDINQKTKLFNILKKHIQVINFFLFRVVFPKEAKQFPSKITRNSWSHVEENRINLVTGFSGTNDTSLLLPFNINQNDLPELKGTNAHVLKCILSNNSYSSLAKDIHADELIDNLEVEIGGKKPNVLLDVGALVIELSNEEVAKKWLLNRTDAKGVVYFCSEKNELVVLSRSGKVKPLFHYNTQNELTEDFLVYLDEIHTRGTDLVLPDGTLAVVTLGARVTKDKFVQGCMRMRKLGKEHSLTFWASGEVNLEIESLLQSKEEVTSSHIILWVLRNSIRAIVDGFPLWGSQAINHMHIRNLIAEVNNVFPEDLNNIIKFGKKCKSKDALSLEKMYGKERELQTVPDLIREWGLHGPNKKDNSKLDEDFVEKICVKCAKYVGHVKNFAQLLSEEQERELEAETEEEKYTEPPPSCTPAPPTFYNPILDYFISRNPNILPLVSSVVFPLSHNFRDSIILTKNLRDVYRHDQRLYCSSEFCFTVKEVKQPDSALRMPSWCMITRKKDRSGIDAITLLAPHEADTLMKNSQKSSLVSLHRFISRSIPQQSLLIENSSIAVPFIEFNQAEEEDLKILSIQLSLFAGSLYFKEITNPEDIYEEQKLTAAYLGICPGNFTVEEELAFQNGIIYTNGFIPPEYRQYCYNNPSLPNNNNSEKTPQSNGCNSLSFQEKPHEFVAGLYNIRGSTNNYSLSDVGRLLTFVKFTPEIPYGVFVKKYLTVIEVKKDNNDNIIVDMKGYGEQMLKDACKNRNPPFPFDVLLRDLKFKTKMSDKFNVLKKLELHSIDLLDLSDFLESL